MKCRSCWASNSFVIAKETKLKDNKIKKTNITQIVNQGNVLVPKEKSVLKTTHIFHPLPDKELLRVFPWWIAEWGVYLLSWEPWAWKSTLIAQFIKYVWEKFKVGYFSGEENEEQIYLRFQRLSVPYVDLFHTWNIEDIFATIEKNKYDFVVIDSIQTAYSMTCEWVAGGVSQIKTVSEMLTQFFKSRWITAFIIWHINKDWDIAWPKYLEHIVDAPIQLEGDKYWQYRFLKAKKNRFWPDDDVGIFEMTEKGLIWVEDYKERVIKEFTCRYGNVLWVGIDNWRPVFVNIEVLITPAAFNYPQRNVIGYDKERLNLILAIMNKYLWFNFEEKDIFLNIPWELSFKKDSGLDLAIIWAIYSAVVCKLFKEQVFFWEVTLMGKIRPTAFQKRREREAEGFQIITSKENQNDLEQIFSFRGWANQVAKSFFGKVKKSWKNKDE